MKKYDLNGFQGEISSFGSYFVIVIIILIWIGSLYFKIYSLSIIIFIVGGLIYYNSFFLGNRYRKIFFDEEYIYFERQSVSLNRIISISETGIIKYDFDGKIKKVLFINSPKPAENLQVLLSFYYKALEKTSNNNILK